MSPELWDGDLPEVECGDGGDETNAQPGDSPGQVEVAQGGWHQRHQPAQDQWDAGEDDCKASSAPGDPVCQYPSSRRQTRVTCPREYRLLHTRGYPQQQKYWLKCLEKL